MDETKHHKRLAGIKVTKLCRQGKIQWRNLLKFVGLSAFNLISLSSCQTPITPIEKASEAIPIISTPASPPVDSSQPFTKEIKATRPWNITIAIMDGSNLFFANMKKGAEQAGADFNVKIQILDNKCLNCFESQIRAIAEIIQQGKVNGLIISSTDSVKLVRVVEKAIDAGIPVIAVDAPINSDRVLSYVGFDNFAASKLAGEWIVKQLNGRGNVLLLNGVLQHQNGLDRRNGFFAGFKEGDIEVLDTQSANWNLEEAKIITAKWLQQFPNIDAILAANDDMALGASQAVVEANRQGIKIVGFDGTSLAIEAIQAGKLAATVPQQPIMEARLAIQMMIRHLETGEKFPQTVKISQIGLITPDNIQEHLVKQ